jgi:phosphoglycerol geranylgeranyltransferase
MIGRVEAHILKQIQENGVAHMTLIDPERVDQGEALRIAKECEACGSSAIMVGGSTVVSSTHLDMVVNSVKSGVHIPVILFPNNITGISRYADALWFMSLLNSSDPYFIMGVQVLAAPLIRKYELEAIPLGYLIVGEGETAAVIGKATPIPYNKPELSVAHALAAKYLGMHFVYLEGGSGASRPVPTQMVQMVKGVVDIPLIVGGGIRTSNQAKRIASAGADIIVTGTIFEDARRESLDQKINGIMEGIKEGVKNRYHD